MRETAQPYLNHLIFTFLHAIQAQAYVVSHLEPVPLCAPPSPLC
jgi:hypothetical protein